MSKRAKIVKLDGFPIPYEFVSDSSYVPKKYPQSLASRHFQVDSGWSYSLWTKMLHRGYIHVAFDGKGEVWLKPQDNFADVLDAMKRLS
jgi:hypothetical protein